MRLSLALALIALAAGRSEGQAVPADTGWPALPPNLQYPRDSLHTVPASGCPGERYYSDLLGIAFAATTSGSELRHILRRHEATIVGGSPREGQRGVYQILLPTAVASLQDLDSLRNVIGQDPHVQYVFAIPWRGCVAPRS